MTVTSDSAPILVSVTEVAVEVTVPQVSVVVESSGPPGPSGTGGGGSGGVIVDPGVPAVTGFDLLWVDVDGTASGGGGGGGGVTDHGALTGLGDPDHPIAAVQGLQAVLDGKAATAHSHTQVQSHGSPDTDLAASSLHHTLGTGPTQAAFGNHTHTPAAVGAEPAGAVAFHEGLADPHPNYMRTSEVLAGANITVDAVTSPGSVIINGQPGGGGGVTVHNDLAGRSTADAHPISAVTGLQTALDAKAGTAHSHVLGDLPSTLATDAEVTSAIATHAGTAGHELLATTNAAALGTAGPGVGTTVARADHIHPMPTAAQVTAEPAGTVSAHDSLATAHAALRGTAAPTAVDTTAAAVGVANRFAREDHRHQVATGTTSSTVALGNHLHTGTYWGLWSGTQVAYDAIGTKDPNTLYAITG